MNCAYKRELEKQQLDRVNQQEVDASIYARCICCKWLMTVGHLSAKTTQKILDEVYIILAESFDMYRDDSEKEFDPRTVPFLTKALQNQVDALEVDIDAINEKYSIGMRNGIKQLTKQARYERLKAREAVVRPYWYAFLITLATNHRYGKNRLEKFYTDIRKNYKDFWEHYMDCTFESDRYITVTVRNTIAEVGKIIKLDGTDDLFMEKKEIEVNESECK